MYYKVKRTKGESILSIYLINENRNMTFDMFYILTNTILCIIHFKIIFLGSE